MLQNTLVHCQCKMNLSPRLHALSADIWFAFFRLFASVNINLIAKRHLPVWNCLAI